MALEIAVQIALVGETELIDQLLKTLVGIHKGHLQLYYCVVVDNLLCILAACALAYCVKVACGYLQRVGVVLNRTLLAEFLCEQRAELVEDLVLALADVLLCLVVLLLVYVLDIEQEGVHGKYYVLSAELSVLIILCRDVHDVHLTEYVCYEFSLKLIVAALVWKAFYLLHCLGAEGAAGGQPYVLRESQQTCREIACDVKQQYARPHWADY